IDLLAGRVVAAVVPDDDNVALAVHGYARLRLPGDDFFGQRRDGAQVAVGVVVVDGGTVARQVAGSRGQVVEVARAAADREHAVPAVAGIDRAREIDFGLVDEARDRAAWRGDGVGLDRVDGVRPRRIDGDVAHGNVAE